MHEKFRKFAEKVSHAVGSSYVFILAVVVITVWLLTGPIFHFSNTWQLVINTGTTIITFLMVFIIQNTQNRESKTLHLKIDELIYATKKASDDEFIDAENLSDEELERDTQRLIRLSNARKEKRGTEHSDHHKV